MSKAEATQKNPNLLIAKNYGITEKYVRLVQDM